MVEIPLGNDFLEMWQELLFFAKEAPALWTLIGAHMVALHGWQAGRGQPRVSRDADILVNVRMASGGTQKMSQMLISRGYALDGVSPEGIGHRFVHGRVRIDILGPDGLGPRTSLQTVQGAHTVAVPGGSQALKRTLPMEVRAGKSSGVIPVPDLLGAILIKARAISVDDEPQAQRGDLAFLLSLVGDPDPMAAEITSTERGWLRRHSEFADGASPFYAGVRSAADAATVFRRIAAIG